MGRSVLQRRWVLFLLPLLLAATRAEGQWAVEAFTGTAYSAHSNLVIRQSGQPDLDFTAHYTTRPFHQAPYYGLRISRWVGRWGVFFDDLHHKLYLTNNPPQVQKFEVTYGYNLFALGAGYRVGEWSFLAGAGPIITNPTSTIRGLSKDHDGGIFGLGYFVDGAHLQAAANRRVQLADWLFLTADVRFSAGWARVEVVNGNADVPNYAVHLLVGLGMGHKRKENGERRTENGN